MSALDSAFDVRPSIPEVADPIALAAEWLAAARDSERRVMRMWSDHAAGAGAFVAILLVLPGWLA